MMMKDDGHQNHPMVELPVRSHDFMFTPLISALGPEQTAGVKAS